jgi:glycosyltransferase involved in cell wall biosynthesis
MLSEQMQSSDQVEMRCGRRLLVSEEGLTNEVGHWYEYCRAVIDIHAPYGIESFVAVHTNANDTVLSSMPALPVYSESSWDGLHSEPNLAKRYWGILSHNCVVYATMDRLLRQKGPVDLIFAPTVTIHHIIGWRALAAAHVGNSFNRLVLLFRNNAGYYTDSSDTPKFRRATRVLGIILKSFSSMIVRGNVVFATDSHRLADEYEALCGLRPVVFPSPRVAEGKDSPSNREDASDAKKATVRFSCLGPPRFEKGIDVLQDAIKRVLARRKGDDVQFVVQWNEEVRDAAGMLYEPDPVLIADRRVLLLTEPLSSSEYNSQVAFADCMLLPYRRSSYFARISGVAVEGATAGAPIIYTRNTWCEGFVKICGAGIGAADGDAEGVAEAIEEMVNNYAAFKTRAVTMAAEARRLNSADAFLEKLWGPFYSFVRAQNPGAQ